MTETFSQQFCSLVRCGAGGRVVAGRRARNCLVLVADGKLVIVMAPSVLLARVPAPMVEILTPAALRKTGTSVVLWLGGLDGAPLCAVEFDTVYRRQQASGREADPPAVRVSDCPVILASIGSHIVTFLSQIVLRQSYRPNPPGADGVPPVVPDPLPGGAPRKGRPIMPNVNVTYAEMQAAARQLQAGEQTIEGDLTRLKHLVDNLVAGGYVTDTSSKRFEESYTQFHAGATKMLQGLTGMGQYLDAAAKAFSDTDAQLAASLRQ